MLRKFALVLVAGASLLAGTLLAPTEASAWRYRCWGCGAYYYGGYRPYYVPVYAGYYGWYRPYYAPVVYTGYYGWGWRRPAYAWGWRGPRVLAYGW